MTIRPAHLNESSKLSALENELFTKENYPLSYGSFAYHIKNNLLFVAEIEEKLVAYVLVLIKRKKAKLYSIGVLQEFRGKNISSLLLNRVLQELQNLNFTSLTLEVRTDNSDAIKLYEKFSFNITKRVPRFYRDGCDAYIMELDYAC